MDPEPREILIVCYGNICRSPMAEVLMRRELAARGRASEFDVTSAGVGAIDGEPAAPFTRSVAAAAGLDLAGHKARRLTPAVAHAAWAVIALDEYVEDIILRIAGDIPVEAWHVDDPYGGPEDGYRAAFATIEALVGEFLATLDPPSGDVMS